MSRSQSKWIKPTYLVVAILALSVVFLWPTWSFLYAYWPDSGRYNHGPLIVLISAYLIYAQRKRLNAMAVSPCLLALIPLVGFLSIWLVAVLASVQAIHQVVMPMIIWTMLWTVLGWSIARRLILAVAYLYLAIPVWESGNFVLQWLTVRAVEIALWAFRVPAFIEGNFVSLPAGSFEIAGGCSGLHYFVIGLAISLLYGALWLRTIRNKVLIVVVAVAAALLTNWLRVFIVVYAGHLTDMQHYLVTHNHYYFGWVLFVIALVPYLWFARRVEKAELAVAHPAHEKEDERAPEVPRQASIALAGCMLCLVISAGTIYAKMTVGGQGPVELNLPAPQGGWSVTAGTGGDWRPHYVGAAGEVLAQYRRDSGVVDLYVNLYTEQQQGRELIGYENRIEGNSGWIRTGSRVRRVPLDESGRQWQVLEIDLRTRIGGKRVLYLWYDVDGKQVVNDLQAKLTFGLNLLRDRSDAGVVIVSARCSRECGEARALLQDWLSEHAEEIGIG